MASAVEGRAAGPAELVEFPVPEREPGSQGSGLGRSVWMHVLGLVGCALEGLVEEPDGSVVAKVRPNRRRRRRCGQCGRRGRLYDQGSGRRRWRGLDLGYTRRRRRRG